MKKREYPPNWSQLSRYIVYEKFKGVCQGCGLSKDDHLTKQHFPVLLQCAHLDHDKTHNCESNLTCLCVDCHSAYDKGHHLPNPLVNG